MDFELTTVEACKLVGLDRQRFNEFVASGDYPCAPDTIPGRSRMFGEADLIALFIFARLTEMKHLKPIIAGIHASNVLAILRCTPNADTVAITSNLFSPQIETAGAVSAAANLKWLGDHDYLSVTYYNTARVRDVIRAKLENVSKLDALARELDKESGELAGE